jgi:hypothetical protein
MPKTLTFDRYLSIQWVSQLSTYNGHYEGQISHSEKGTNQDLEKSQILFRGPLDELIIAAEYSRQKTQAPISSQRRSMNRIVNCHVVPAGFFLASREEFAAFLAVH